MFAYLLNDGAEQAVDYHDTFVPIFPKTLVWKVNVETQQLECYYLPSEQVEEEPPYNFLLAC